MRADVGHLLPNYTVFIAIASRLYTHRCRNSLYQ